MRGSEQTQTIEEKARSLCASPKKLARSKSRLSRECDAPFRKFELRSYRGVRIEAIGQRRGGRNLAVEDRLRIELLQRHYDRAQRMFMRDHQHRLAAQHPWQDCLPIERQHAR